MFRLCPIPGTLGTALASLRDGRIIHAILKVPTSPVFRTT